MNYMLLIYTPESVEAELQSDPAAAKAYMDEYNQFTDEVRARKVFVAGEALHPTASATTVRLREGKRTVTDGPFAETKEQLGGFYILNVENLDQDRKSTRLNSSHSQISYAVFCLKKKNKY